MGEAVRGDALRTRIAMFWDPPTAPVGKSAMVKALAKSLPDIPVENFNAGNTRRKMEGGVKSKEQDKETFANNDRANNQRNYYAMVTLARALESLQVKEDDPERRGQEAVAVFDATNSDRNRRRMVKA